MSDMPTPITSADAIECSTPATKQLLTSAINGELLNDSRIYKLGALFWISDPGIGYLPVTLNPYDEAYFAKYQGYAQTSMGQALNVARLKMVARYWDGPLLDIGIGSGQFVLSRANTKGFDVNPVAVRWLQERGLWQDPYKGATDATCFWDSLEHIKDPVPILDRTRSYVFMALPIFRDIVHVLRSKHYRPDEHCWYFTEPGLIAFMNEYGWAVREMNWAETALGREDIRSYVFARA